MNLNIDLLHLKLFPYSDEALNLKTYDMIMCCLVRAIAHLRRQ
jgi:hypothetical protein